jgi:predicted metal-dependent phosphoesterase TrpH
MTCKVDLHVHSRHSNDPSEWYLRRLGAPESYTEPLEIYRSARARGMDYVTISDHDSIAGALEIAHLPGVFLSNEVTATFPEDGCEIHCLVFGISEAEQVEIQRLRGNVYELRDYLRAARIAHSVAHPLFRVNDRLTLSHFEKLIVLFEGFETLNGMHDRSANEVTRRILSSLTRKAVEDAAERHGLEPFGPTPWVKRLTGGSDDHGGHYVATTFTRTPEAATLPVLLDHLREGRCEVGGETGSSARLARSLYSLSYEYYRRLFPAILGNRNDPFVEMLRDLAEGPRATPPSPRPRLRRAFAWVGERLGLRPEPRQPVRPPLADRFTTLRVGRLSRDAYAKMLSSFFRQARRGRMAGALGEQACVAKARQYGEYENSIGTGQVHLWFDRPADGWT